MGLPWWLSGEESACSVGDMVSIPGLGRSAKGNGNPLQYSCLGNPTDRGVPWTVGALRPQGRKELEMT